jgi:hypothetical protein
VDIYICVQINKNKCRINIPNGYEINNANLNVNAHAASHDLAALKTVDKS